jgi:membrane fusion protein, type I secretion system
MLPNVRFESEAGQRLQPGTPAEVLIKTGQRTPLQDLMQPLLGGMHRAWREQ